MITPHSELQTPHPETRDAAGLKPLIATVERLTREIRADRERSEALEIPSRSNPMVDAITEVRDLRRQLEAAKKANAALARELMELKHGGAETQGTEGGA